MIAWATMVEEIPWLAAGVGGEGRAQGRGRDEDRPKGEGEESGGLEGERRGGGLGGEEGCKGEKGPRVSPWPAPHGPPGRRPRPRLVNNCRNPLFLDSIFLFSNDFFLRTKQGITGSIVAVVPMMHDSVYACV